MVRLNRATTVLAAIVGVYLLLLVITPYTMEPGTLQCINGNANRIDFADQWNELPPVTEQIYLFGDLNCHQKCERSYFLNGNQVSMCARDVGMFLGILIGSIMMISVEAHPDAFETGLRSLPKAVRKLFGNMRNRNAAILIFTLTLMPTAIDGFAQLLTSYESTNPVRLVSGAFMGIGLGIAICALLESSFATSLPRIKKVEKPSESKTATPEKDK